MLSEAMQQAGVHVQPRLAPARKDVHGMSGINAFKEAWNGLLLNKLRSFLTTLGIIIGVAAVIIMLAVSAGAEAQIADQIRGLGANLLMVSGVRSFGGVHAGGPGGAGHGGGGGGAPPGQQNPILYQDALAIAANVPGVVGVSVEQDSSQNVTWANTTMTGIPIVGVTADFPIVRDYTVAQGRFILPAENDNMARVAVIGYGIAQDLFGQQNPIGQDLKVGSTRLTVVGVMAKQGAVNGQDNDGRIYIPVTLAFKKFAENRVSGNPVRMIFVKAQNEGVMASVAAQITSLLAQRRKVDPAQPDFSVRTQQDIVDVRASTTATFRNLLAWVAAVSLVVGGIGIMNIMLVSVTERTREIGLRRALGARPRDVRRQFLFEAVVLSLVGGVAGILFGLVGAYAFGAIGGMRMQVVPLSLPLSFFAAAAVGIFFGYYPATQAARLDPIEALRRE